MKSPRETQTEIIRQREVEAILEGKLEGKLQTYHEVLQAMLEERFSLLREELVERMHSLDDADRLQKAIRQVSKIQHLDELHL